MSGKQIYSNEQLIEILKDKTKELGRTPSVRDLSSPNQTIYIKRFGSLDEAFKKANLQRVIYRKPKKVKEIKLKKELTKEDLLQKIKDKIIELDRIPTAKDMKKPSYRTYYRYFDSWSNALKECLFVYKDEFDIYKHLKEDKILIQPRLTKEEFIEYLKNRYIELGRIPFYRDIKHEHYLKKYFNGLNDALLEAGIINSEDIYINISQDFLEENKETIKPQIIAQIQKQAEILNRTPYMKDIDTIETTIKDKKYYLNIDHILKLFGKWNILIDKAKLDIVRKTYTKEELITSLINKYKELGRVPLSSEMKKPNYDAYKKEFGVWKNALAEAGLKKEKKEKIGIKKADIKKENPYQITDNIEAIPDGNGNFYIRIIK